ncbi:unnamed protein product [Closterium sp. NIES-53]
MASHRSTSTYVDAFLPCGANVVMACGSKVKRSPRGPPVFKVCYVARGFKQRERVEFFQTFALTPKMTTLRVLLHIAAQRDYELHSLDFSAEFLLGSLHEKIWLRCPPGFTGLSLLGPSGSYSDQSTAYVQILQRLTSFRCFPTHRLASMKEELQRRHTCTDLGVLQRYLGLQCTRDRAARTITLRQSHMVEQILTQFLFLFSKVQLTPLAVDHGLIALPSNESFAPSGPYPELVGYLICKAEVYAAAMAAQELYRSSSPTLVSGLSPPVLYADNMYAVLMYEESRLAGKERHIQLWVLVDWSCDCCLFLLTGPVTLALILCDDFVIHPGLCVALHRAIVA